MRLYHKLHKNPCKSKRATLIRNVGKRMEKLMQNPARWQPSGRRPRRRPRPAEAELPTTRKLSKKELEKLRKAEREAAVRTGERTREIFEEIFTYQRMAEDFHGLEVEILRKVKLPDGATGYVARHPWFPDAKDNELKFHVCTPAVARRIGAVSMIELSTIGRRKRPKFFEARPTGISEEGEIEEEKIQIGEYLPEEIPAFCCLAEEPETPKPGKPYRNGILICMGRRIRTRGEGVLPGQKGPGITEVAISAFGPGEVPPERLRVGGAVVARPAGGRLIPAGGAPARSPELPVQNLYRELERLSTRELELMDVELSRGRVRKGPVSKARQAYLESDPLSTEGPKLKKKYRELETELSDVRSKKKDVEKEIRKRAVIRPPAVKGGRELGGRGLRLHGRPLHEEEFLAGGGEATPRGLAFRYGEEEAARLGAQEREFREEILLKTGGRLKRIGKGRGIPLNERFLIKDTNLIGVIWDEAQTDLLTGKRVGKRGKFSWEIVSGTGQQLATGEAKKTPTGGGKASAAGALSRVSERLVGVTPGAIEAGTIQEAILSKRPAPSLGLGEHLIAQFIAQEAVTKPRRRRRSKADWRDVMRWGLPTPYTLVEFYRDREGYHVTLKLPSGTPHRSTVIFKDMTEAVEYALLMVQELVGGKKFFVDEGPRWTDPRPRRKSRVRKTNPSANPGIAEIIGAPFLLRPKRKRSPFRASEINWEKKAEKRFEILLYAMEPKETFDFGFMFGVLYGIDTCGLMNVIERRKIRRSIEQGVLDAIYAVATEAPKDNPKKNPDTIEMMEKFKDVVAPPGFTRPKRKPRPITVDDVPDLTPYFMKMVERFDSREGFDFGFVFGLLRGIDTCGLTNLFERRRIRRTIEASIAGMSPPAG